MWRLVLLLLFTSINTYSQEYKDTTFSIRGSTCSCKYNFKAEDDNNVFISDGGGVLASVERTAYYSGDSDDWKKFVKKNLDKSFKGKDKVEVRFQVDKNGDLSNFELMSRSPAQKFQEAIRILKLSGKWFPTIRNGYCVSVFLSRTFEL